MKRSPLAHSAIIAGVFWAAAATASEPAEQVVERAADVSSELASSSVARARGMVSQALAVALSEAVDWRSVSSHSVEEYLALRTAMAHADARLSVAPSADRHAATEVVIDRVGTLLTYLSGWLDSGTMSSGLEREAKAQRYLLFENLVSLQASIGNCAASQIAMEALRALDVDALGPSFLQLRESAADVADACEAAARPPVSPLAAEVVAPRAVPRVMWGVGGAAIAIGGGLALGDSTRHEDMRPRAVAGLITGGATLMVAGLVFELVSRPDNARPFAIMPDGVGVEF